MNPCLLARMVRDTKAPFQVELTGASMGPLLPVGTRLQVDPECSHIAVGDIVVIEGTSQWITHRVLHLVHRGSEGRLVHLGDASRGPGVVAIERVVGKVVGVNTPGVSLPSLNALTLRRRLVFGAWRTIAIVGGFLWTLKGALRG